VFPRLQVEIEDRKHATAWKHFKFCGKLNNKTGTPAFSLEESLPPQDEACPKSMRFLKSVVSHHQSVCKVQKRQREKFFPTLLDPLEPDKI